MKFNINKEELPKAEILEFKGEFEQLEKIDMEIEENKVLFKTSYLVGERKTVPDHIILQVNDGKIEPYAIADVYTLFARPPKYISKKKNKENIF